MSWQKQSNEQPLFPDVLWNQPINQRSSGSLLIIGGHATQFSYTQSVYTKVLEAGIGKALVALPKSLRKLLGSLEDCHFLPETPSGSLADQSLDELTDLAQATDAALLAGELSNNSETVKLLGRFIESYDKPIIVDNEVLHTFHKTPETLPSHGLYVSTVSTASSLARSYKIPIDIKATNAKKTSHLLDELSQVIEVDFMIYDQDYIYVQSGGRQSVTDRLNTDSAKIAAFASVFYLHHEDKYEALTTAAYRVIGGKFDAVNID